VARLLDHQGQQPRIAPDVFLAPDATVIGDVEIGAASSLWFGCVVRGDVCFVRIGSRTNVQDGTIVHVTHYGIPTRIGDEVMIGHRCVIHACTIEDRAFIGMSATLMDEVVVESGGMVAAGALVGPGKRVAAGELWGGVPARRLRSVRSDEYALWEEQVQHYVDLAALYRAGATS
jgi:carbonic anhydrase/acetyltransferase-like protein (isoleucine patch superfamily)